MWPALLASSWVVEGTEGMGMEPLAGHPGRHLLSSRVAGVGAGIFVFFFFLWVKSCQRLS